jgi:signal transduction histidine kinase
VGLIIGNSMESVQLVHRMGVALCQRQILVDAHVFAKDGASMAQVEKRIAAVEADFAAAARVYAPLALAEERAIFEQLQREHAASSRQIADTLSLSQANRTEEARAALRGAEDSLVAMNADVSALIQINRIEAERAGLRIDAVHQASNRRTMFLQIVVGGASLLITLMIIRAVHERGRAVARYAELLEVQNRDLDAFAGHVAHDLRGPLGTIAMATGLLAQRFPAEDRTVCILRRATTAMEELIEDLLSLSKLSAGALQAVCDPAAVAARVREEMDARFAAAGATLRVAVEPALVRCGEGLLRQVLVNLADNGVKYRRVDTPAEVEIRGRERGSSYELRVSDNGVGMSPDEARRAFDPFFRATRVRDRPGTGLGLSIVKRVVDASGGSVHIDSELGRGTTFVVTLVRSGPAAPPPRSAAEA